MKLGPLFKFSLHQPETEICHIMNVVNHINNHIPGSLITVDHLQKSIFLHYEIRYYNKWSMLMKNAFSEFNRPMCFMKPIQISIMRDISNNNVIIEFINVPLMVNHQYMIAWFHCLISQYQPQLQRYMKLVLHDCRLIYRNKKGATKWDTTCFNIMVSNSNRSLKDFHLLNILRRGQYNTTYPHEIFIKNFAGIGKNIKRFLKYDSTSTMKEYFHQIHQQLSQQLCHANTFNNEPNHVKDNHINHCNYKCN